MMQRLKAQGLKMASINTNGLGDMGNQYEDPDFVKYRQEQQDQNPSQQQTGGLQEGSGSRRGGSLTDYAGPTAMSGAGSARPSTSGPAGRGARSLGEVLSAPPSAASAAPSGRVYAAPPAVAPAGPAKPVSLANFVNNGNSGMGSGRRR
jgi:hypothetical protein